MGSIAKDAETEHPLEYQIFALALRVPGAISYFHENLPAEAVGLPSGQAGLHQFYTAFIHFYDKTGLDVIDQLVFQSWLKTESVLYDSLGGAGTVTVLMDTLMDLPLADPESVTKVLKYRHNKRRQLDMLQELQGIISKKGKKDEEEEERVSFLTDQIRSLENDLDYSPLDRVVTGHQIADRAMGLWELPSFLPTQFKSLNRAMGYTDKGGFFKGAVHAVIAASGKGKSTFSKSLMNYWVETGLTVLYVNYEEPEDLWERTLLTQITKHNVYKGVEDPQLRDDLTVEFQAKMREWGDRFMVRHDPDTPYFDDLEQWIRDIRGHNQTLPDVIIIDTIQSLFMRGSAGKPRWGEFEVMMVRLEKLARDLNCVLIITAQENANRMKEGRDVVKQTDTGGSLTIQQKCAVTIFITDKKLASGDDSIDDCVMELQIPKNRITGSAFAMDPATVRYNDDIKSYEEYEQVPAEPYNPDNYLNDLLGDIHS